MRTLCIIARCLPGWISPSKANGVSFKKIEKSASKQ